MALTKRERWILILAGAAVGLLVLDSYVVTPLWQARSDAQTRRARLAETVHNDRQVLRIAGACNEKWDEIVTGGMKTHREDAETQVYRAVDSWAKLSGLKVSSVARRDRLTTNAVVPEVAFQVSGQGTIRSVTNFVWRMQTAGFPLRISRLEIASPKPGTTDLTLNMQVEFSTIYKPEADATKRTAMVAATGGPGR